MSTQSVLDQMTAGIMSRKEEKAAGLTPVGFEKPRPPIAEAKGDVFPHDGGIGEQIIHSAKIIRSAIATADDQLRAIEDCLRAIEREAGLDEGGRALPTYVSKQEAARLAEREKETKSETAFKERFEAQAADAQAQVFPDVDEPESPFNSLPHEVPSADGWQCPDHGIASLNTLTSRKGRTYRACGKCEEFER